MTEWDELAEKRKIGAYWVRHQTEGWLIAVWDGECWDSHNFTAVGDDSSFVEIDERPIERRAPVEDGGEWTTADLKRVFDAAYTGSLPSRRALEAVAAFVSQRKDERIRKLEAELKLLEEKRSAWELCANIHCKAADAAEACVAKLEKELEEIASELGP